MNNFLYHKRKRVHTYIHVCQSSFVTWYQTTLCWVQSNYFLNNSDKYSVSVTKYNELILLGKLIVDYFQNYMKHKYIL
jgi:hypothetical protein